MKRLRVLLAPCGLALAAVAAFSVDLQISHAFRRWNEIAAVHNVIENLNRLEPFGHGLGVLVIIVAAHQLDPARRWAIPRLFACVATSGLIANLIKVLVVRVRPNSFAFDGSVWDTFGGWLPWISAGSCGESFPSGHTAAATALAGALIWLYPNGRVLFIALAALVGCQRVAFGSHYVSDVLFGAAVGCFSVSLFFHFGLLPQWFERLEARWRAKRPAGGRRAANHKPSG